MSLRNEIQASTSQLSSRPSLCRRLPWSSDSLRKFIDSPIEHLHLKLNRHRRVGHNPLMHGDTQKRSHRIPRKGRETMSAGHSRKVTEPLVFFLRQPDADHPRARLQDLHCNLTVDRSFRIDGVFWGELRTLQSHEPGPQMDGWPSLARLSVDRIGQLTAAFEFCLEWEPRLHGLAVDGLEKCKAPV